MDSKDMRFGVRDSSTANPSGAPQKDAGPSASSSAQAFRISRVLIVDDQTVNRLLIRGMLRSFDLIIEEASEGKRALAMHAARPFDLILMDCHMPVMDGIECTRQLRAQYPGSGRPIVIGITGDDFPETLDECKKAGMDRVLEKPMETAKLHKALAPWLAPGAEISSGAPAIPAAREETLRSEWVDVERVRRLIQETRLRDPDYRLKAFERFQADASELHQTLVQAFQSLETDKLKDSAHGLKGMSLTMGLNRLAEICKHIESAIAAESPPDWTPVAKDFETTFASSLADLRRTLDV